MEWEINEMKWNETTTPMAVIKNAQRNLVRYPEGAGLLKDWPIGGKKILKWILDKWCMKVTSVSIKFIEFSMVKFWCYSKDLSDSVKVQHFLYSD
jgi:predicted helicase